MDVSIVINDVVKDYKISSPFYPTSIFPELNSLNFKIADEHNLIYSMFREAIKNMAMDQVNYGKAEWNPFSSFIKQGDAVVIKPNLVLHHNNFLEDTGNIDAVVTNAALIRPIIDYVLLALKGTGKLIIADAPHGDADFESIVENNGLLALVNYYKSIGYIIELRDLRKFFYPNGFTSSVRQEKSGDPEGYTEVDLGCNSYLEGVPGLDRLYGSDFNRKFIVEQHKGGRHKYMVSNTILKADVIISVPKLKTHKKTGITINLKNLVGINGNKNYLAHYRVGPPSQGGDEYPDTKNFIERSYRLLWNFSRDYLLAKNTIFYRQLYRFSTWQAIKILTFLFKFLYKRDFIEKGNWYGNDTCWRMCLDLNLLLKYCDKDGTIGKVPKRKYLCVVDGIVSGEGDGPMEPSPKPCGSIIVGYNPYYTDFVCSKIMGFDPDKINLLKNAKNSKLLSDLDYSRISVFCEKNGYTLDYDLIDFKFRPQPNWIKHIER